MIDNFCDDSHPHQWDHKSGNGNMGIDGPYWQCLKCGRIELRPAPRDAWANEYHGYGMILVFYESKEEAAMAFAEDSRSNKDKCCILFREVPAP